MTNYDEQFYSETEEDFKQERKKRILKSAQELPVKYYMFIIVIAMATFILYKSDQVGLYGAFTILGLGIIILFSTKDKLSIQTQHSQPECLRIVRETISREMNNSSIDFPSGKLIISPVTKPDEVIKGDTNICRKIYVEFIIVDTSGLVYYFTALVHPYEPKVLGVERRDFRFKGTEIVPIKILIPTVDRVARQFFGRR